MNTNPYASMASYLMSELLDELKTMRTLWPVTPQQQQQETIDRIAKRVDAAVRKGVKDFAGGGFPAVVVHLKKIDIDAEGTVARIEFENEHLHALTDVVGTDIVMVLADPQAHTVGINSFIADSDQPSLAIE